MYDIIGDVHGHAERLEHLLKTLGYHKINGIWTHSSRKLISVGDLIDRGPQQRQSVDIIRDMQQAGSAYVIMGNHEFNAIAWATLDDNGQPLRKHNEKNEHQHREFLKEKAKDKVWYDESIAWFKSLPFYLQLDGINVVHACWQADSIEAVKSYQDQDAKRSDTFWQQANQKSHPLYEAIEVLCKGWEIKLPCPFSFKDEDGHERHHLRTKWWLPAASNYGDIAINKFHVADCADLPISQNAIPGYSEANALFFGHYWFKGNPVVQTPKIACVDWSVAEGGCLVAYRYDGEDTLLNDKLVAL